MAEKKYGHFDDANREYVITDPKTPWPWINYLGNEDFFSLISNTAGGYSFYKDAKFRRLTRYRYNGVPMDNGGRYFYIKDGDTVWNPGWKPCKTPLDSYECRHGMNYTRITGSKNGVEASVLFFVPLHTWAEVQKMTLKNQTADYVALGSEMDDAIHLVVLHQLQHQVEIADITLNESIVWLVLDVLEVSQVACVCQLVEVDDVILRIFVHEKSYYV